MAAEIATLADMAAADTVRFNEAAANGRGNRWRKERRVPNLGASMRPRRMAAEIARAPAVVLRPRPALQ